MVGKCVVATQIVKGARKELGYSANQYDMAKRCISNYATENDSELLAEAVGDVVNNGDKARPLSKEIYNQLKRRTEK